MKMRWLRYFLLAILFSEGILPFVMRSSDSIAFLFVTFKFIVLPLASLIVIGISFWHILKMPQKTPAICGLLLGGGYLLALYLWPLPWFIKALPTQ